MPRLSYLVRIRDRSAEWFNTLGVFVCGAAGLVNHMVVRDTEKQNGTSSLTLALINLVPVSVSHQSAYLYVVTDLFVCMYDEQTGLPCCLANQLSLCRTF